MELREVSATSKSPYRCYVRGKILRSEGENVHTIGFKDGLAVVQVISPPTDADKIRDSILDKAIDLTKLKKITVKVDPQTGKKYIHKDGKKIEILPQVTNAVFSLQKKEEVKKSIIIKDPQSVSTINKILSGNLLTKLATKQAVNGENSGLKYHVVSLNVKKQGEVVKSSTVSTMTDCSLSVGVSSKCLQTDNLDRRDCFTQTESGRESPSSEQLFFDFILGDSEYNDRDLIGQSPRKMIDPSKLKTKDEINRFNFFNDMRKALNFDRSGNLPIHESVMQNNLKDVQKRCVVLRAVRESVNLVNHQGYTPLHLAILHDGSVDVIKTLLHHGADLSVPDPEGNTAIHLAIENGRSIVLKVLITFACDIGFSLDCFNYEGFTPLILACLNRSYNDAKLLLQHGADPNIKDMKSGRTALFHAAECFDVNLVELLMEYKADTKIRNFFGTSPHDAMFEVEDMPMKIKFSILGRDHQRLQSKRKLDKSEVRPPVPLKKAKLQTTPVLRRICANDMVKNVKK